MPQTTRKWTYRDPLVTVTYPAGTDADDMPAKRRKAAEEAGVLEQESKSGQSDGAANASAARGSRSASSRRSADSPRSGSGD